MQAPNPPEVPDRPCPVLLVSEPGVDGVFHYVRELANHLHGRGWPVHLAYSSVRDCPALHDFVDAVKSWGGRTLNLRVGNAPSPADASALRRLRSLAKDTRPGVIHAHSSKAGVLARTLPMLGVRARYFYTPHAYYQMHGPKTSKKRFFGMIERVFGGVGTTICTSGSEAEYARNVLGVPARRVRVAVTGVDCERFRPAATLEEKREARGRFGLPTGAPLLGTVARLSAQKDPLTLYRAVLDAMTRRPDFCFAHLGKGELSGEIDAMLAAAPEGVRTRVYRVTASPEAPTFYRALDAFTLPSRYEGFALSALEALATGLPLILTKCPGNDDLESYEFDALRWSAIGDHGALAAQILGWLDAVAEPNNHREITSVKMNGEDAWNRVRRCYAAAPDPKGWSDENKTAAASDQK